jgi:hypothetical protein
MNIIINLVPAKLSGVQIQRLVWKCPHRSLSRLFAPQYYRPARKFIKYGISNHWPFPCY